jgi:DNA-binding NarL/FixJ family response regulator
MSVSLFDPACSNPADVLLRYAAQDMYVPAGRTAGTARVKAPADADGVRCVIVDDNDRFVRALSGLLVRDGFDVVGTARDRTQGLWLVAEMCPDVALIDLCLGRGSGIELIADFVRGGLAAQMFMILVSTWAEDELREVCGLSDADGYLSKMGLSGGAVREVLREHRE